MEPEEPRGSRSPLQAAREPLSLRFLIAFSASTVLTAAVAVPMAFQAHLARQEHEAPAIDRPAISVLGTSTVPVDPGPEVRSDGLVAVLEPVGERVALEGAELPTGAHIEVDLPGVARVDFVLDDGEVLTDREAPFSPLAEGDHDTVGLDPGAHVLGATVTFEDGRVELLAATFRVTG